MGMIYFSVSEVCYCITFTSKVLLRTIACRDQIVDCHDELSESADLLESTRNIPLEYGLHDLHHESSVLRATHFRHVLSS
jgi:hypothetical protein